MDALKLFITDLRRSYQLISRFLVSSPSRHHNVANGNVDVAAEVAKLSLSLEASSVDVVRGAISVVIVLPFPGVMVVAMVCHMSPNIAPREVP